MVGFFFWTNHRTAKAHARFQAKDVEDALLELVSPDAQDHDTWDLFLAWRIDDPYLESIRQRCRGPSRFAGHFRAGSATKSAGKKRGNPQEPLVGEELDVFSGRDRGGQDSAGYTSTCPVDVG